MDYGATNDIKGLWGGQRAKNEEGGQDLSWEIIALPRVYSLLYCPPHYRFVGSVIALRPISQCPTGSRRLFSLFWFRRFTQFAIVFGESLHSPVAHPSRRRDNKEGKSRICERIGCSEDGRRTALSFPSPTQIIARKPISQGAVRSVAEKDNKRKKEKGKRKKKKKESSNGGEEEDPHYPVNNDDNEGKGGGARKKRERDTTDTIDQLADGQTTTGEKRMHGLCECSICLFQYCSEMVLSQIGMG
jgi:hypothetical protein